MKKTYGVLLTALLASGCATTAKPEKSEDEAVIARVLYEQSLRQHLDEWQQLKPEINELIALKKDLELLITALSISPVYEASSAQSDSEANVSSQPDESVQDTPSLPEGKFFYSNTSPAFYVHLASYLKPEDARKGWETIKSQNKPLLDAATPVFEAVTVNGTDYISLRAGPFSNAAESRSLCNTLKQQGQYCALVRSTDPR